jgi:hypothetical protein
MDGWRWEFDPNTAKGSKLNLQWLWEGFKRASRWINLPEQTWINSNERQRLQHAGSAQYASSHEFNMHSRCFSSRSLRLCRTRARQK